MEQLVTTLTGEATKLAALVVTLLLAMLTKAIMERMKAGQARDVALELAQSSEVVVRHLEQTLRPVLEAGAADGKLTHGDIAALKSAAITDLKDQMSNQGLKLLAANSARLEDVLSRSIESAVSKKNEAAPPPAATLEEIKFSAAEDRS